MFVLTSLRREISSAKRGGRGRLGPDDLPTSVSPRRLAIETACLVTVAFALILSGASVLVVGLAGAGCASLVGVFEFFLAMRRV
jgi:hypothetical protein